MSTLAKTWPRHMSASSIERVDVDRAGRRVLTLRESSTLQWWCESASGWSLTAPADDSELPFRERLQAELARPGALLLTWKPGRRLVLLAQRPAGPLLIKAYRRSGFEAALAAHGEARRMLAGCAWNVAELVGVHPQQSYLEFAFVAGAPLEIIEPAATHFFRLGAGLRQLQSASLPVAAAVHTSRDEQRVIEVLRQRSIKTGAVLPDGFDQACERLGRLALRIPPSDPVPCHRDLHDGQILRAGNRLTCLDFDLLCLADTALDAANLVAHLQLRALQRTSGATTASVLACARAFLEGLDREGEPGFGTRLCWYQAATFLRLAEVHSMRPRWAHLVEPLLALAVRCMEDLERG